MNACMRHFIFTLGIDICRDPELHVIYFFRTIAKFNSYHSSFNSLSFLITTAMLAAIGMLVTEEPIEFHPLFEAANKDIGPAIRHLDEVRAVEPIFFEILGLIIGALELNRALVGWKAPDSGTLGRASSESGTMFQDLNDDYYPGDVGFDPLNLKPEDPEEFAELHTKELQNGRLAMIGASGMILQELVNGKEIFVNLGLAEDRFDAASQAMLPVQF